MKPDKNEDKEYYVATRDENGEFLIYCSDGYKISEIDLINLIKICVIEARSKSIGKKILSAYRDSTEHRAKITQERLKLIGIKDDGEQNTTQSAKSTKTK